MKAAGADQQWIDATVSLMSGNTKAHDKHREAVLAQSDYTRRMQELTALKKQEQDELTKTTEWAKQLTAWEGTKKGEFAAAVKAKNDADTRLASINAKIQELKTQGYLDDSLMPTDLGTPAPKVSASTGNGDQTPSLTREDALRFSWNSLTIADQMDELRDQHKALFAGVNDPARKFSGKKVLDYCNEKNVKPEDAWRELYGVDTRREELRAADEDARVEKKAQEMYAKRVSEDIQAGRPVAVRPEPSNMARMTAIPDLKNQNPYQRHNDRVRKAVAKLESSRATAG
jgi:hypothetical protein